jgi:GT2 family glycosyltransferase
MRADAKVLAICVNWNGAEVLSETLQALQASDYAGLDILVIDNASSDGSQQLVPAHVRILHNPTNIGYGAAINRAVIECFRDSEKPAYLLLINNDVCVAPEMLRELVDFAENAGPGVFGPKVLNRSCPGRLDMAWGRIVWNHVLAQFLGKGACDGPKWNETRRVQLLQGSILLVHREVFERTAGFDEKFFMYHEEVDWLLRAGRLGYPVYYCPFAEAYHHGAHSTRDNPLKKVFWLRRNTVYFFRKHRPGPAAWTWFVLTLTSSMLYNALTLRWKRAGAILRGVWEGTKVPLS